MGFVFTGVGYVLRMIMADRSYFALKRYNKDLIEHRDILIDKLNKSEYERKKVKESFFDLRRRYDKIYSNNYKK